MAKTRKTQPGGSDAGTANFKNTVGLSLDKTTAMLKLFKPLEEFGPELYDRLVRYVLDGDDDAGALAELAGRTDAAKALGLMCASGYAIPDPNEKWVGFLATIEPVDPRFYLRLGKVFEAAART